MPKDLYGVQRYFNIEIRKHPSFLLFDTRPTNYLSSSETYARNLLGRWDNGLRILDIGCGDAVDSIVLAASTNQVWAIDLALNRLVLALENVQKSVASQRVLSLCMDAHALAFPDNYFDLVVGNSVLLFLDRQRFAAECYRVLKPGGRALFPNESMRRHPLLLFRRALPGIRKRESVADRITLRDIDEMGKVFDHTAHREFYLTSVLLAPILARFGQLRPVSLAMGGANAFDQILLQMWPRLRDLCWIGVIEFRKKSRP